MVALLVRMDDAGMALMKRPSQAAQRLGMLMVAALPWVIKTLGVVGTVALLLVSGGIFHHHLPGVHEAMHAWPGLATDAVLGLLGGAVVMLWSRGAKAPRGDAVRSLKHAPFPQWMWRTEALEVRLNHVG